MSTLQTTIDTAWEARDTITTETTGAIADAVNEALNLLDTGQARVAEKTDGGWQVNQWLKKAVLLSFRLNDMAPIGGGPDGAQWFDKVASKFQGWDEASFREAGFRAVPNCIVRRSAYIAPGVILTPFQERYTKPEQLDAMLATIPQGRHGVAEDCVGAYLFLASGMLSGYMIGQVLEVNGGQLMP